MEKATGADLGQFRRWYSQAGTPCLHIAREYDSRRCTLELRVEQRIPGIGDGPPGEPMHIPLAIGLPGPGGQVLHPDPLGAPAPVGRDGTLVFEVRQPVETFRLHGIDAPPLVSVLRGFSAPVKIDFERSDEELTALLAHDPDSFARWDAGQQLALSRLDRLIAAGGTLPDGAAPADPAFVEALRAVLRDRSINGAFAAELLTLPSESYPPRTAWTGSTSRPSTKRTEP